MWQALVELIRNGIVFFGDLTGNYGVGIIILTVLVRLALVPLTVSQSRSTAKMQKVNPEIEKIKKKYKDDPTKQNEETMRIWKEHGVNPLAGCLPLLLQMPIIIAMFQALRGFEFAEAANFLWIPELASPDPLYLLPIMAGLATFLQTKMSTAEGAGGNQAIMVYGMPVFIAYISMSFPAGLALYWTVTNAFGVAQQYLVNTALAAEDEAKRVEGDDGEAE